MVPTCSMEGRTSVRIGVPTESRPGETLVAVTPKTAAQLMALGYEVSVQSGAGAAAKFADDAYVAAGATIGAAEEVWASDVILKVNEPSAAEIGSAPRGRGQSLARMALGRPAGTVRGAERQKGDRSLAGRDPADLPGAVDGCAVHDVQHRRLPGRDRGGGILRRDVQRPGHRGGEDPAGHGFRDRRRGGRPGRDRRGRQPRRPGAGVRRPARGRPSRSSRWARRSSRRPAGSRRSPPTGTPRR